MIRFVARYLWGVSPHFATAGMGAGCLALFGAWTVTAMPSDLGAAYVPLLFGQLFGASSGFRQAADAGHFDGVLVSGAGRILVGTVHLGLSTAPGMLAWFAVHVAEVQVLGGAMATGLRPPYVVVFLLVSCVAWAISLPTSRFTGGVLWVGGIALGAASPKVLSWVTGVVSVPPSGAVDILAATAALVCCPFLFLVPSLEPVTGDIRVLTTTLAVAATAAATGLFWIVSRDYPGPP